MAVLEGFERSKIVGMKILALDSSGLVASVAVAEDGILLGEYTINYKKTHSQTLLPMLEAVRDMIELDMESVDAIAVAAGPGSFTGLRIGSATAKGLAQAMNKPVIGIPTLEGLAYNLYGTDKLVCPLMDARRNQVYTGVYTFQKEEVGYALHTVKEQCAADISQIVEILNEAGEKTGKEIFFLGDGVPVFQTVLSEKLTVPFVFAPAHLNRQRAAAVAALGEVYFRQGKAVPAAEHVPEYLRLSQAERERIEQERTEKAAGTAEGPKAGEGVHV